MTTDIFCLICGCPYSRYRQMMTAENVLLLLETMEQAAIRVWLDGGWGVDALLGKQTRPHQDLDLVLAMDDVETLTGVLAPLGFRVVEEQMPTRMVLASEAIGMIDCHPVVFDEAGNGRQQLLDGDVFVYPQDGFTTGVIQGRTVPCLDAKTQLEAHLGYEPQAKDVHDVLLLCHTFDLNVPAAYAKDWSNF